MRERKSNMLGDVVRMEALNAGQNIGAVNYIDQDDFYPASGITENSRGDIDTIDMVYDHRKNDMSATADFFDGDYQNSYADGGDDYEDFDDEDDFDGDYEDFDDEDDFDGDYEDFDDEDDFDGDYEDFDDEDDFDGDYEDFDDEDDFDGDYEDFDDEDDYDNYDGINPEDTEAEWGDFDGDDTLDMDESIGDYNDMPSGAFDFFDGGDPELDVDYNGFDSDTYSEARGRRKKSGGVRNTLRGAVERRFGEEGQARAEERREDRRKRREDRLEERKERRASKKSSRQEKREERQSERKSRREARQELRAKKKLAKIGEIEARSQATTALSQQPAEDPATAQIMADLTKKSSTATDEKKGLSTGAIVGISLGALAVVGTALFLILRKKK
jgi:DNA-directed RNA polymerase subunit delta